MKSQHILFTTTLVFSIVLEITVRWILLAITGTDGFGLWPPIDNIMHFMWGLNIFFFFVIVLKWKPLDAVYGVFVWQMGWELVEMIGDITMAQPVHMLDHFFLDGIKDTFVDIGGALLGWLLIRKIRTPTAQSSFYPWMNIFAWCMLPIVFVGGAVYIHNLQTNVAIPSPDLLSIIWIICAAAVSAVIALFKKKYGLYRD
ncbi:MAG TPA: hypothetical protein VK158_03455 [Acidobacteriota bacterium]|nr:hypothetical protein [Acidobacteriota bacterium]